MSAWRVSPSERATKAGYDRARAMRKVRSPTANGASITWRRGAAAESRDGRSARPSVVQVACGARPYCGVKRPLACHGKPRDLSRCARSERRAGGGQEDADGAVVIVVGRIVGGAIAASRLLLRWGIMAGAGVICRGVLVPCVVTRAGVVVGPRVKNRKRQVGGRREQQERGRGAGDQGAA